MTRRAAWTREEVLAAIVDWTERYGSPPAQSDWNPARARHFLGHAHERGRHWSARIRRFESGDWPWADAVRSLFGNWNDAIEAAGYDPRHAGRQVPVTPEVDPADLERAWVAVQEADGVEECRAALHELASVAWTLASGLEPSGANVTLSSWSRW